MQQQKPLSPETKKRKAITDAGKAIQELGGKDYIKKIAPKGTEKNNESHLESGSLTVLTPVRASKKERTG